MIACSAPGKVILFGEHAVVFGEPALAVAINLRTKVRVVTDSKWSVNRGPIEAEGQRYVKTAIDLSKIESPLKIDVESDIPEGSGMGSSAAVAVATLGALHNIHGDIDHEKIARMAFEVEHTVQGRASPIDTSTSTHGQAILVLKEKGSNFLWQMEKDDRRWFLHHREMPVIDLVVGHTGIQAATGPLVAIVKKFVGRDSKAREMITEIGQITLEAVKAISVKDWETVGRLMDRNHRILTNLGVGHPSLDKLIDAVKPYALGAKLTGAGGGGSMIALTERPIDAAKAIESAGGRAFKIRTGEHGLEVIKQ